VGDSQAWRRRTGLATCALGLLNCTTPSARADAPDRISLTLNGSSLTGTHGGEGAALGWLHNFDTQTVAEVSAEHQVLSHTQWTLGGLDGSLTRGQADSTYTWYGSVREGRGVSEGETFDYSTLGAGVIGALGPRWSVQLEDRQIDVQVTHGNLPKLGVQYLWNHQLQASIAYAYSVSGNLGTRLTTARLQAVGLRLTPLVGLAFGQAAPQVVNLQTGTVLPGRQLREGYAGLTVPLPSWRGELTVLGDYLDLAGSRRATLTVNYLFRVGQSR
jgi:hypothetical protein